MKIKVISDVHLSRFWDRVEGVLPQDSGFLNPNVLFEFSLNQMLSDEWLIINGDLVDYQLSDYEEGQATNWEYFFSFLEQCQAKVHLNLGNHDYRLRPYNLRFYGLSHLGVSDEVTRSYYRQLGHHRFRYWKELGSIATASPIGYFPRQYQAFGSKILFPRTSVVLLNTGPDAVGDLRGLWPSVASWRYGFSVMNPTSRGLLKDDLVRAKEALQDDKRPSAWFFLHCPLFDGSKIGEPFVVSTRFLSWQLLYKGLAKATFVRNRGPFLQMLLASSKNVVVVSSHTHEDWQCILDKETGQLRQSSLQEVNDLIDDKRFIKFISSLALGALSSDGQLGYLVIEDWRVRYEVFNNY